MIQVENLTKNYGARSAVDGISFRVERGEVLAFLGPNGAGKTTTMKMITGCLSPTSGSVQVDGKDILENPVPVKSKMGYLPEIPPLYEDMYVENYLVYTAQIKRCPRGQIQSSVRSAMEKTGIVDVRKRLIQNLSKGYRQRVGLAQALVADPEVLILDEPTVGLDPSQVIEMRGLIRDLKKSRTLILSTHILSEAEANCEKVVIINEGKIAVQGSLSQLRQKMREKNIRVRVRVKTPTPQLEQDLKSLEGVTGIESVDDGYKVSMNGERHEALAQTLIQKKAGFLEMIEDKITLEDIFISIVKKKL